MLQICITTIAGATDAVRAFALRGSANGIHLVVAGDRKGPDACELPETTFLSLQAQREGPFDLARLLPVDHYVRKNTAYLEAIRTGAGCIYETDDDNAPLPSWGPREERISVPRSVPRPPDDMRVPGRWVNVYRYFTPDLIWPRGLPLDEIHGPLPTADGTQKVDLHSPIQQGLANGAPDVDAIWRLTLDRAFEFGAYGAVWLAPGNWCPFNSQSTWWWPVAYPLLYLPSCCSFRMCDIWRSFVAQRCLWELGCGVVFHAPEVFQERNPHSSLRDFCDEIPGYTKNKSLVAALSGTVLREGNREVGANLMRCYESLVRERFLPDAELPLVAAWLSDLEKLQR